MNKFVLIFLLLFFVGVIIVGVVAVRQEIFKKSEAGGTLCAIPKLNLADSCPSGQRNVQSRAANGCIIFKCQ